MSDIPCLICMSPYRKATVNRLFCEEITLQQIADLVDVPVLSVLLHEREVTHELMQKMDANSKRIEAALAQQRCGVELVVDGLPTTEIYRFDLPDGKTVNITIHIEEASQ